MYNSKVIDHFTNPRNMGEIENPDATAQGGNPLCGDVVKLYLKVKDNKISEIKFKAFGCGACIASSSALTEMIEGKSVSEARKITNDDIVRYLGGLPEQKKKCSNFSADVLQKAIKELEK